MSLNEIKLKQKSAALVIFISMEMQLKRWLYNTNIRCKLYIDTLKQVADEVSWGTSTFLRMKTLLAHVIVAMATKVY